MNPIESVDKCTTCATCVAYCPVTRATRAFNGPKLTGPSSERFRLLADSSEKDTEIATLEYCSNCKNCDIACPSGVRISTLNMLARGEYCRTHRPPLRDWVLAHGGLLGKLTRWMPNALLRFGMTNPLTRLLLDAFGIDRRAPMPVFAPESFSTLMAKRTLSRKLTKKVVFFPGCYVNDYDPRTGLDLVELLEMAGYETLVPDFQCCGVPLIANGFHDDAEKAARHNASLLASLAHLPILTVCPSCSLMLKQEYCELFPQLDETAVFSPRIEDACEFVAGLMDSGALDLTFRSSSMKLVYHAPCHLRAQGIGKPGLDLLRTLPGINIEDARSGCCGISGSYGFKKDKYPVATAVGADLFKAVHDSQAECCLSECGTCRLQISHHTGIPSLHPLSYMLMMAK